MNILILNWRDPKHPLAGGAEKVTQKYSEYLVSMGHSVYWFSSKQKNLSGKEIIDKIKIIRKGNDVFGVQISAFFWYLFADHPQFDIVIDQFHGLPFFTPLYVKKPILG